ncbi:hypothetical protein OAI_11055 [Vibrio cyclitrophicus FF160]|uniref:hypothetical protein n=1 Tax=Vibrio cyclitrophicus TaxID=47951 RepID=UPI000370419F|nr:hypothetical protein [Vibrio cyclitrophicus]OEE81721.1 hypothetical protein OAI_11055 [Vibrio cyclitrophicus FF160]
MEEAAMLITWKEILTLSGTLIIMPLIFFCRDSIVLFFIDKFIANEGAQLKIERWAVSHCALEKSYSENERIHVTGGRETYFIGTNEVAKSEYDDYHAMRSYHAKNHQKLHREIMSKQRSISRLTKCFKIEEYKPIEEEVELVLARHSANN